MSEVVIRAEGVSKRYRIDERQRYYALRDLLARYLAAPFRALKATNRPSSAGAPEFMWALKDVSFEVRRGEVLGIIGRNGAGKSTLLKVLSRITTPTEGYADIMGRVGSLLEVGTGFHPELTGRDNLYLNGAVLGMKKAEIARKFDEVVAFAEIHKFIDTPVKRYSSGMYLRLAFSVAAHLETEILLVDEVLAVGDASFQKKCLGKIGEVMKEGRTVLFISHNMAAVEQLCTRAMLLADGRLKHSGPVSAVIESYLREDSRRESAGEGLLARGFDGALDLLDIGPVDEKGKRVAMAQCGRDLSLSLVLRAAKDVPRVSVSVGINNVFEFRIAVLHSGISGHDLAVPVGTHTVVCKVPCLPLAAGTYTLDVKVLSGKDVLLWAPRVEQLLVEGGDFYETGRLPDAQWGGVCHLHQQWHVRHESC
jgi:lipopolysaccharide transport system ATP-binding protein